MGIYAAGSGCIVLFLMGLGSPSDELANALQTEPAARLRAGVGSVWISTHEDWVVPVGTAATCPIVWSRVREAFPRRVLATATHRFELRGGRLRTEQRVLYDVLARLCAPLEFSTDSVAIEATVLSAIGPWVTVREVVSEALAGGPPYHAVQWQTFDARTGQRASLLDVVAEAELVGAIAADPWINARLGSAASALPRIASLALLRSFLREHGGIEGLESFAFLAWDAARQRVALRIAVTSDTCGLCLNDVRQLGIWIRPRRAAIAVLQAAASGHGRWMDTDPVALH